MVLSFREVKQPLYSKTFGSGPHLVLLHGWGVNSDIWSALLPLITENFAVTLVDLPGYGGSDFGAGHYDVDSGSRLPEKLLQDLQAVAPRPAIWMGWSLGAVLALAMAVRFPQQVRLAVSLAGTPRLLQDVHWPGVPLAHYQRFQRELDQHAPVVQDKFLQQHLADKGYVIDSYKGVAAEVLCASNQLLGELDLRTHITTLAVPQHYLFAGLDPLIPVALADVVCGKAVTSDVISQGDHGVVLSHPHVIEAQLRRLLSEVE